MCSDWEGDFNEKEKIVLRESWRRKEEKLEEEGGEINGFVMEVGSIPCTS